MATKSSPTARSAKSSEEKTRELAQKIYEERVRNNEPGDALSDWIKAEERMKKKKS